MAKPKGIPITSPEQWSVLVAPVRLEIAEGLRCIGPCSVAELAALLDRPADTLYRHLELLQEAGFVVSAGYRKRGRHVEQLVALAADDIYIAFDPAASHDGNDATLQTARGFMRATERAVRDSAQAGQLVVGGPDGNVTVNYELGWLTDEAYREIRGLVHRIKAIMDQGKRRREGRLFLSLAIVTPVTRKPRRTRREESASDSNGTRATRSTAKSKAAGTSRKPKRPPSGDPTG